MLKIRGSRDRLICNIGIPIPGKDSFYIDTGTWTLPNEMLICRAGTAMDLIRMNAITLDSRKMGSKFSQTTCTQGLLMQKVKHAFGTLQGKIIRTILWLRQLSNTMHCNTSPWNCVGNCRMYWTEVTYRLKLICHDDVIKWKHFPRNWPFVRGIHRSPVNSLHKGQWRGALIFTLICVWINNWVNNGEAGDLRRYRIHYDVTVMYLSSFIWKSVATK